ncbi:ferritin heavy chain-like protein, partial [Dinothrombium tinctorium]
FLLQFAINLICFLAETEPPNVDRYPIQKQCINLLQKQINSELSASLVYLNMAAHFDNVDIGRKGFAKFFKHSSFEEREHAQKIIDYVNLRGGRVTAVDVKMPIRDEWPDALTALREAMELETKVNNEIHEIHYKAEHVCKDPHLMDFLESEFMEEQINSINELRHMISMLSAMNNGMGEYHIDRELFYDKHSKDK